MGAGTQIRIAIFRLAAGGDRARTRLQGELQCALSHGASSATYQHRLGCKEACNLHHLYNASRRQSSPALRLLIDALRYRTASTKIAWGGKER
jgi:hypothetical protein